jgi:hypothetical protein
MSSVSRGNPRHNSQLRMKSTPVFCTRANTTANSRQNSKEAIRLMKTFFPSAALIFHPHAHFRLNGTLFNYVLILETLGPLSLVSTIENLIGRNSNGSGLESREFRRRDPSR